MNDPKELKQDILRLTREYSYEVHGAFRPGIDFERNPLQEGSSMPYVGSVFYEDKVEAAVSSTLYFCLSFGSECSAMEKELPPFLGVRHTLLANSDFSANLVAISALTSALLPEDRRIKPGDEVITVAAGFPTTVILIMQVGAIPVFIDADPIMGNAPCEQLESAYSPNLTKSMLLREVDIINNSSA